MLSWLVQVMDLQGLSHEEASQRVLRGMDTVLAQLPASSTTWTTQQACVPGCVLMLADVAVGEGERYREEEVLGENDGEQGELQGENEVAGGAYLQQHQQRPQLQGAACHGGTWRIDVSQRSASNALCFLAFMSISSFEAAAGDGSLLKKFAAVLSRAAAQEASTATQAAASGADPLAIASWGGILQLALQLPEDLEQQQSRTRGPNSSSSTRDSSTGSKAVRLVLVQGQYVLIDQEVLTEVSGRTLSLLLQLPMVAARVCQTPTAAALYVLPAESLLEEHRSSSSGGARAAVAVAAGPLAHLTLLLLPPAAAAELLLWVEQLQLSPQQLQPLLEDMAVAVEACGAAAAGPAAAAQLSNAAFVWAQAAAAAGRVLSLAHSCPELRACEDMMAVCCQQLLVALRRTQPLAAGGLPSAEEASQLSAAAAVVAGVNWSVSRSAVAGVNASVSESAVAGVNGSVSKSAVEDVSGPQPEEGMAEEGAKVAGSGGCEAVSAAKLDRSSARGMHAATPPIAASEEAPQLLAAAASGASGSVSTSFSSTADLVALGVKPKEGIARELGKVLVPVGSGGFTGGKLEESSTLLRHELGASSTRASPAAAAMLSKMGLWWWGCVLGSLNGWKQGTWQSGSNNGV